MPGLTSVPNATLDELYSVLCGAASQDPVLVMSSTNRLKEMHGMFGTIDGLNAIATEKSTSLQVRQQSIIQLKNLVPHSWRSRKLLSDEQRVNIRARCLTLLDEKDDLIAQCNAIIIAKIARMDYPQNWPTLLIDLMSSVSNNAKKWMISDGADYLSGLVLQRSLEILNGILKELTTIKMMNGVKTMSQVAEHFFATIQDQFKELSANLFKFLSPSTVTLPQTAMAIRITHLCFKSLVKMSIWLWQKSDMTDYEHFRPWVCSAFELISNQLQSTFELRINLIMAKQTFEEHTLSLDYLARYVHLFGKFFRRLQQVSTAKFILLPACSNVVFYYWSKVVQATTGPPDYIADGVKAVFPIRFLVQAMVLFKDSLTQWSPVRKNGSQNDTVLSQGAVEEAVHLLITRIIPLNPKDLDAWVTDPEEWVNSEEKDDEQWEFEIRPCGERVLLTICNQYPDFVTPLLVGAFTDVNARQLVNLENIIQKETVYCAIGRCAFRLKDVILFNEWLVQIAVSEIQEQSADFAILKRRIAWVIGKWLAEECASPQNPIIWQILTHLLSERSAGTDMVVRFTAATALRRCLDTSDFDAKVVEPFIRPLVVELLNLVSDAETFDMKRKVMETMNTLIEQSGMLIVSHSDLISESIPQLWNIAEKDFLFKAALLETIAKTIEASKNMSGTLYYLVITLIQDSLSNSSRTYLDAEALTLWQAAMRNASALQQVEGAPSLLMLFPLAIDLLTQNLDLLGDIRLILESYLLLDATTILRMYAVDLLTAFRVSISQAIDTNVKSLLVSLSTLVRLAPAELWAEPMHISGLFSKVLDTLADDNASTLILTEHINLMARAALSSGSFFVELISATALTQNKAEPELWDGLLDQWWRRFDNMYEPRHRKLAAMGIANLVATGHPKVLERLATEIFNLWLDVFGEIKEAFGTSNDDPISPLSHLVMYWRDTEEVPEAILEGSDGTLEFDRRRLMYTQDPVTMMKLTDFVAERLVEAQARSGGPKIFESLYLQSADPTVLRQLYAELQNISIPSSVRR